MTRTTLLLATLLLGMRPMHAQQEQPFRCLADDLSLVKPLDQFTAEELAGMEAADAALEAFTQEFVQGWSEGARSPYIIAVVFHIIHDNGPENISDAQVIDAMRILNEDFNRQNPDWQNVRPEFLDIVADVGVEFRLARKDPQGNCTNGITRTRNALTHQGDQAMKDLVQWPRNRYLNVWVSASAGGTGVAGYTYRPNSVNNTPGRDGIVMRHNFVGAVGTGSPSGSRTLTHEVGHWINLSHTWGNSNNPGLASNCSMDDSVADTPNTQGWTSCNLNGSTCDGTLDNVENYMEYAFCSRMFTEGQAARMIAALNSTTAQRNQLWQQSTLAATGIDGPGTLCMAQFISTSQSVCMGGSVAFEDVSYHNITDRTWSFPGGTPETSSDPAPTVSYATAGTYPVTLTVSDGLATLTQVSAGHITVHADPGSIVPVEEGFETYPALEGSPWTVVNPDGDNTFVLTTVASFSGDKSVRLVNNSALSGKKDELVSSTYDMSSEGSIRISYRYAFARRTASNDDRLRFFVSNNCGQTWSLRQQLRGNTNLNTGGVVTGSFVPTASQWHYAEVANVSATYHTSDFRFKFEFESDGGNNLYIDDININGSPVGLEDLMAAKGTSLIVVPNPATDEARAVLNLRDAGRGTVELLDVLGRRIQMLHDGQLTQGPYRFDIPVHMLQSGMYFVRLQQGSTNKVERFVVR